jgi:hypothetical protein
MPRTSSAFNGNGATGVMHSQQEQQPREPATTALEQQQQQQATESPPAKPEQVKVTQKARDEAFKRDFELAKKTPVPDKSVRTILC